MKKNILYFILSLIILFLMSLVLIPYFSSNFKDIRQKQEIEANYQKLLRERLAQRVAKKIFEDKIYLTGKFDPSRRDDFILIPSQFTIGGNKMYLRKEAYESFLKMQSAAKKDEVDLKIASATRNFEYQRDLWNKKWTGVTLVDEKDLSVSLVDGLERFKKILEYSAVPGTSRHHWGTDIDINGAIPSYFDENKGKKEYEWLKENASKYGFCQPYSVRDSGRPTGYNEEKWHWSYLPLAQTFTQEYKDLIKDGDIQGFNGDEYVRQQDLIHNYVLGISTDCI